MKFEPEANHTGTEPHLLREILRVQQAIVGVFARDIGMPPTRLAILRLLAVSRKEHIGVIEIARAVGVDAAAITRQLADMERMGWVVRKPDPTDRRRISARLTPQGVRQFENVHARAHALEADLARRLPAQDIATTIQTLATVRKVLESNATSNYEP